MKAIPRKLREQLAQDPEYRVCARKGIAGHVCGGRVTWEHAMIHAGRQVQERWAIIPLCERAHAVGRFQDGGDFDKNCNEWIALNRATDEELLTISKARDYVKYRGYLNGIYGEYCGQLCGYPVSYMGIASGLFVGKYAL